MSAPTRRESPPGSHPAPPASQPSTEVDVHDPTLTRFDLVREGAHRDEIEIVHYEPRFPPGSPAENRVVRTVAALFLFAGLASTAFVVAYIAWPWEYELGSDSLSKLYTPVLGVTLGLALFAIAAGLVVWVRKLLPHEVAIEERHYGGSSDENRTLMGATLTNGVQETGLTRRPLLGGAVLLGLAPVGVLAVAPLVGGLIKDPHRSTHDEVDLSPQDYTGWHPAFNNGNPIRLVREDGTPVQPSDVSVAGQLTVFPGIPGGATNEFADSPVLLIRLREEHAAELRENLYELNADSMAGDFVAYSKICTHAGCPPSLLEQQSNLLLCPCHQSQFLITDNARSVFGPAARSLAMLPLDLDDEGFFVATSDFRVPVGPSYWER